MNAEQLKQALYDKMFAEQELFRHGLMGQSVEEALNHAYEYAVREDILMEIEEMDLPAPQAAALLASSYPLSDIYKDFSKLETGYMETIKDCIEDHANRHLEAQQTAPFYQHSGAYAQEHGELEQYRASRKANIACRDAIESAVSEGYDGRYLARDTAKSVLAEFGPERVSYVLAATLQEKTQDERFSRSNHDWAAAIPMYENSDRRCSYIINNHSAILDGFVNQARKEMDAVREPPERAAKKPSIKGKLAAKSLPGDKPAAKVKEGEVR